MIHATHNRYGAWGDGGTDSGPMPLSDIIPSLGTGIGNLLVSSQSAVQRQAQYAADLQTAVARGAPIGTILSLQAKLKAAQYEVTQQQAWDAQQQEVLGGVKALQIVGVAVGIGLVGLILKKIVE